MDIFASIYNELLQLQRKSRFVGTTYAIPLLPAESHLMVAVDADTGITMGQLSSVLELPKGTVSRLVGGLNQGGYLVVVTSKTDKRQKHLYLTPSGEELVATLDEAANANYLRNAAALTMEEIEELRLGLKQLADQLGADASRARTSEYPLRLEIRRLTRSLGLLGASMGESSLNATQYHVLMLVAGSTDAITASALCEELGLDASTVSRAVAVLERRKLIKRENSREDRRQYFLNILKAGGELLEVTHRKQGARIGEALKEVSQANLKRLLELFRKYVGSTEIPSGVVISNRVEVQQVNSVEELQQARGFVVAQLIRHGRLFDLPERIVAASSYVYVLKVNGEMKGVHEIAGETERTRSGQVGPLVHAVSPEIEQTDLEQEFVAAATRSLKQLALEPEAVSA